MALQPREVDRLAGTQRHIHHVGARPFVGSMAVRDLLNVVAPGHDALRE